MYLRFILILIMETSLTYPPTPLQMVTLTNDTTKLQNAPTLLCNKRLVKNTVESNFPFQISNFSMSVFDNQDTDT